MASHARPRDAPAAVRTLILYPTNALVEDQMTRLGERCAGSATSLPSRPLWFGRYTGVSLGSTKRPSAGGFGLRGGPRPAEATRPLSSHACASEGTVSEEDLSQFPDPTAHELLVRWDMVETPTGHPRDQLLDAERDADAPPRRGRLREDPGVAGELPDQRLHPRRRRASPLPRHPGQRGRDGGPQPAEQAGPGARLAAGCE